MPTEKVYSIKIEMAAAQQSLDLATKTLAELKNRAQAANQESKEAKQVYEANARALRELVAQNKQLTQAQKAAAPGDAWGKATAALQQNVAEQAKLNQILEESRLDYAALSQAAETATGAVGLQTQTVQQLAEQVKDYRTQAEEAAQAFAPGTFGAIRQEVEKLQAELQHLSEGSAEAAAKIQQIAQQESKLRGLAKALEATNPEAQAQAFGILTGAIAGTVGVAVTCAQMFGLSEKSAQEYTQQMQQLTGVLASVDAMSKVLNGENLSLIKSIWGSAKAWLGYGASAAVAGEAALAAGEATAEGAAVAEAGLLASGVGAIVVAIGLALAGLIVLWGKFGSTATDSTSKWTQVKAVLSGLWDGALKGLLDYWKFQLQVLSFDWNGAAETARKGWAEVAGSYKKGYADKIAEGRRAELANQVEHSERILKVMQAQGVDTEKLERDIQRKKVAALKQGSKEYADAAAELAAFDATARRKHQQEAEAETLAHLNRLLGFQQAYGRSTYELQVQMEEERLRQLEAAPERDKTAIRNQMAVIAALKIAHERDVNDKLFAARQAALEGQIALEEQKGEDAFKMQVRHADRLLAHLRDAGTQDAAAIKKAEDDKALLILTHNQELDERERRQQAYAYALNIADLDKQGKDTLDLRLKYAELIFSLDKTTTEKEREQKRADYEALLALQIQYNARQREITDGQRQDRQEQEATGREAEQAFYQAAFESNTQLVTESLAKKKPDLGLAVIKALFGLGDSSQDKHKAEVIKQAVTEIAGKLSEAGAQLASALLDGAMQQTQQALERAQQQLQEASDKLSEAQSRANDTASQMEQAQGARKQFLLERLAKERREVAALAAAKAKAAAEEQKQLAEQHRLERISAQLTAGSALATNVATAAQAVYAGVKAVSAGSSIPFPGNIVAIATGIAAVVSAVASAKQLATATKYEAGTGALGSDGVLRGPSHAQGGIPFTVAGVPGFEAEGGEAISPRDASTRNAAALALIRTEGRTRTLGPLDYMRALGEQAASVQRLPPPDSYFEAGGVLNKGGGGAGTRASDTDVNEARADRQLTNRLLSLLVDNTGATASNTERAADHAAMTAQATSTTAAYGPPRIVRGYQEVIDDRELLKKAEQAENWIKL